MIPLCIGLYFGLAYVVEFFELLGCLLTMIFGGEDCEDGVEFETPQVNLNQANFYLVLIFNIIGIIVNAILIAGVRRKNPKLLVPALAFSIVDILKCAAMTIAYSVIFGGGLIPLSFIIYILGIVFSGFAFYNVFKFRKYLSKDTNNV